VNDVVIHRLMALLDILDVMASVTEEEKNEQNRMNQPGLVHLLIGLLQGTNQASNEQQNSRTSNDDQPSRSAMMGKLCKRVLALIKYKVGADGAVDEHMVQALEAWLQKRGISIYTDHVL
jgi:hypothetical protein